MSKVIVKNLYKDIINTTLHPMSIDEMPIDI